MSTKEDFCVERRIYEYTSTPKNFHRIQYTSSIGTTLVIVVQFWNHTPCHSASPEEPSFLPSFPKRTHFASFQALPSPTTSYVRKSPTKYIEKQEHPNPYPSPNATMRATSTALLLFSVPYAAAFVPATPLSARTSIPSHAAGLNTLALAGPRSSAMVPQRHAASSLKMVDDQVIMGAGVAIAGLVFGAGLVYFTEKQGERTAQRGGISDDTKMRMSAMFMEDDVVTTANSEVDDIRSSMRNALRADQTDEELAEMTAAARKKAEEEADDGW